MLAGWITAHFLGYWIAVRDAHERHDVLQGTGHGYLKPVVALAAALVVVGLIGRIASSVGRPAMRSAPPATVFLLAPLGFVLQEHLERTLHLGAFPYDTMLDPPVLLGLVLQAPFALLAFLVARALLASADALSLRLAGGFVQRRPERQGLLLPSFSLSAPRTAPPALGGGSRAPPPGLSPAT